MHYTAVHEDTFSLCVIQALGNDSVGSIYQPTLTALDGQF